MPLLTRLPASATVFSLMLAVTAPALGATLQVGAGKPYPAPSAAAAAARDGDRIVIAAGEYVDCAFWKANDLTIEGASPEGTVITDTSCGGKGLFVISGNRVTVRNLTLTRARVPAGNGEGIRAEGGDLTIEHVRFIGNQNGILSAPNPAAKIIVRDSEFLRNGTCENPSGCAHGIYAGGIGLLRVERSRFFETREGHHIKSRALRTEVIGCDIADGVDGTASYAIEVPNGGGVVVRGNRIQKGPKSENHTAGIMIGAEGVTQRTPEITVESNGFAVTGDYTAFLVVNMTATEAMLKGNTLSGGAKALQGDGRVQ